MLQVEPVRYRQCGHPPSEHVVRRRACTKRREALSIKHEYVYMNLHEKVGPTMMMMMMTPYFMMETVPIRKGLCK